MDTQKANIIKSFIEWNGDDAITQTAKVIDVSNGIASIQCCFVGDYYNYWCILTKTGKVKKNSWRKD